MLDNVVQALRVPSHPKSIRQGGISILELLVTLFIVSIVMASVTALMYQTTEQIAYFDSGLEQQAGLQLCWIC